jgi:hypothetical protein
MMPKRQVWAKLVSESNNDLNMVKLWALAVWSVWGLVAPLLARICSMFGRTVEKAAVRSSKVLVSVVPAWPMGKAMNFTHPQKFLRAAMGGISRFFFDLGVATEVPTEADLHDDEGACCLGERGWFWGRRLRDPSFVDEVRFCAIAGLERLSSLFRWKDPIGYSAGGRSAFGVSIAGGETPGAVSRVLRDVYVALAASFLYCR